MKNKGFTLIELLGVIVILTLIVLLVIPSVINSVKNSSEDTDEVMFDLIYKAADLYTSNHSNIFPKKKGNKYTILLQDLVNEGYLNSPIEFSNSNDDITNSKCINASYENDFVYELKDISTCSPKCHLYNDQGKIGVIDVGDKIQCESNNEYFYVISNDNGKVDMLTQNFIGCGGNTPELYQQTKEINPCVYFNYSGDASIPTFNDLEDVYSKYLDYENLYIGKIFNNYHKKLINNGIYIIDIKPISFNELLTLGCNIEFSSCDNAPEWVTQAQVKVSTSSGTELRKMYISYWTRTSYNTTDIFIVSEGMISTKLSFNAGGVFGDGTNKGIGHRPVVSIQEKDINIK